MMSRIVRMILLTVSRVGRLSFGSVTSSWLNNRATCTRHYRTGATTLEHVECSTLATPKTMSLTRLQSTTNSQIKFPHAGGSAAHGLQILPQLISHGGP